MKDEVISSPEVVEKKKPIVKPIVVKIILIIVSLVISFFVQYFCYRPNLNTIIDSDMDAYGNTYVLSISSGRYKVSKISPKGYIIFEKHLDKSSDKNIYKYSLLEADSNGNFFIVQEVKNTDAIVPNPSQYPISYESVKMYDSDGNYGKEVALFDFASSSMSISDSYIKKIQISNAKLYIVGLIENNVDIIGVNPYIDKSPEKEFSFKISPPNGDKSWINDYSVLSDGSTLYSTKNGNLYLVKQDETVTDCNSLLPNKENSIDSMYVDNKDNVYFTDYKNGSFYKFDTHGMNISSVYSIDDKVKLNDLTIKDLRKIRPISDGDFFGSSKSFSNPFFARFGSNQNLISKIRYKFFPFGLLFTVLGALIILSVLWLLYKFKKIGIKRTYISVKAALMFIPVFIILMVSIVFYSTSKSMANYVNVLRQNQTIGAKIVSEKINGDYLVNSLYNSNYMSSEFASMKSDIKNAYVDLKNKVGDNSDYIVIYALDNNKIYSITNNKYSGDSKYYGLLDHATPDMTQDKVALVDSVLEKDEIDNIYSVWSKLKDLDSQSVVSTFRDVHGDIVGAFVPVKNSSGTIVGMVANYLDEKSHVTLKLYEILKESSILIGIISLLVILYLCLIMWILLKPMKIMNKGIEVMINGHWKNKLPIVSKDEFASISTAFNNMSNKLEEYTDNLMDLNSEYLRYVPKDLLKLSGKDKITQSSVGERQSSEHSIVYITFNVSNLKDVDNIEESLFDGLQNCYSKMFDIVEEKDGIVQNFSSLGATLLFDNPEDAVNSTIQILESDIDNIIKENMRISVGMGSSIIGIIGNDVRRGVSMASEEMLRLIKIDKGMKNLGIKFAVTEYVTEKMSDSLSISFRFIGKFKDISELSWVKIYEIIYSSDTLFKDLIIQTKSKFERAVHLYIDGEFNEARALFVDVLHKNQQDKTALYYINLCDLKSAIPAENSKNLKDILGDLDMN